MKSLFHKIQSITEDLSKKVLNHINFFEQLKNYSKRSFAISFSDMWYNRKKRKELDYYESIFD